MKKKWIVALLAVLSISACSFAACNGGQSGSNSSSQGTTGDVEGSDIVDDVYYKVTFDLETDIEVEVKKGETIQVENIPSAEKAGWNFLGWYLNDTAFDFSAGITSDITLTPKYEEIIPEDVYYTVTFDLETDVDVVVKEGEKISLEDVPSAEKDGWEFLGWYVDGVPFDLETPIDGDITLTPEYSEILGIRLNEYAGGDVSLLPEAVKGYLECKTESEIAEYLYKYQEEYVQADSAVGLELAFASNVAAPYEVHISQSEDFADAVVVETEETSISVYNLVPATYYWKVLSADGYESITDSFVVADGVRMINCGNIVNMRDEGGWTGELGTVKYGMVYRSAAISESDEDKESANEAARKVLLEDLKIATEIDLRLGDKTQTISPLINKENCGIVYMDPMFPGLNESRPFVQSYADALKKAFLLFTDESNYPINYHCAIGADRTGTFSLLLGGLLGLSYEDLATNFEISSFYQGKRWRSAINVNGGVYSFDESGVMQDNGGSNFICSFGKCYNYVMATYGTGDGKTSTAFANYFKTVVGLSDSDIEKIRSIMLESYENSFESVESQTYASADVTFDKTLNSVSAVYVNGVKLSANDYAVSNNRLTVKKAYVDTLQTWKNHVSVEYDGGKFVSEILIYTHISDYAGLQAISENPYGYYILDADIDCGNGALVLGDFYGVLDGNGHMIKNVKNSSYWGKIFNSLHINAVIKNVGFYNITNTFLIGDLDGKLQNVSFVQLSGTIIAPIASTKKGFCNIENFIVYASNVSVSGLVNGGTLGQYNNVYVFTNKEHENGMYVSTMWGLTGETGTDYVETDAYKELDFTAIFDFSKDGVWMMDETLGIPVVGELPKEVETFTGESHTYQEKDIIVNDIPFVDIGTVVINGVELVENDYVIDENGLTIKAAYIELLADWKNAISVISVDETKVYNAELLKYTYISNYAELKAVADAATTEAPAKGYYILTQDIDCANQELYIQSFSGVLDGNGHTISNIKLVNKNYRPIFGTINAGAVVKNVGFYNVTTARNNDYSFGLVYDLKGRIENVSFHQNNSKLMIALINKVNEGASIENLVVYASNVKMTGLSANWDASAIDDCTNVYLFVQISNSNSDKASDGVFLTGETGTDYLETNEYKAIDFTAIFDCSEEGMWEMDETLGIPRIKMIVAVSEVNYTVNIYQEVEGVYPNTATQTFTCQAEIGATVNIDGAWMSANGFVMPESYIIDKDVSVVSGTIVDGNLVLNVYLRKVTLISTYAELKTIADASTSDTPTTGYYLLTTDIDCENQELYIQSFSGVLDGNGHTISNIKLVNKNYRPIFGTINAGAVVKNVGFYNVTTARNNDYSFGLVYDLKGRIENVSFHQNNSKLMRALINKVNEGASIENLVVYASNVKTTGLSANWDASAIDDCTNVYLFVQISNSNSDKASDGVFLTGETGTDYLETNEYKAIDFTAIFDCSEDGIWTIDETLGIPLI